MILAEVLCACALQQIYAFCSTQNIRILFCQRGQYRKDHCNRMRFCITIQNTDSHIECCKGSKKGKHSTVDRLDEE